MARSILKTGNAILKTAGKIFVVGDIKAPLVDLNPSLMAQADNTAAPLIRDYSGNGLHANQGVVASQGTFRTNQQNGKAGIVFDGVDDWYYMAQDMLLRTIFLIHKWEANQYTNIFSTPFGNNVSNTYWDGTSAGPNMWLNQSAGNFAGLTATGGEIANTVNSCFINTSKVRVQPQDVLRPTVFNLITIDLGEKSEIRKVNILGKRGTEVPTNRVWRGTLLRFVGYEQRLTTLDRQTIAQGLFDEYAL